MGWLGRRQLVCLTPEGTSFPLVHRSHCNSRTRGPPAFVWGNGNSLLGCSLPLPGYLGPRDRHRSLGLVPQGDGTQQVLGKSHRGGEGACRVLAVVLLMAFSGACWMCRTRGFCDSPGTPHPRMQSTKWHHMDLGHNLESGLKDLKVQMGIIWCC